MKIAIINPPRVRGHPVTREDRLEYIDYGEVFPPLTLLYTAAILEKKGYNLLVIDANGFDFPIEKVTAKLKSFKPDILLTRFAMDTIPQDAQVVQAAKKANPRCLTLVRSMIILNSPLLQNEVFSKYPIDFLVTGDMEVVVPELAQHINQKKDPQTSPGLGYLKNNQLKKTGPDLRIKDINSLPYPAYHLSGGISCYQTGMQPPIFTNLFSSRGCPYSCKFCASHDSYQARTPESVVNELEWLIKDYHLQNFYFFDDIFTINQPRAAAICQLIIKRQLKLKWSCGTRVDNVNQELLQLMKRAGCWQIAYGIESGNQKILNQNSKGFKLATAAKAVKMTQTAGIFAYAMMVLGLPGETKTTIKQTFKFIDKINPDYTQYCIAVPFPNTPFFDEYQKKGWITSYDWTKYNPLGYPVISTPTLSDKQLHQYHYQAYRRFLFRPKFLLSRLQLRNWRWNLLGLRFMFHRTKAILSQSLIR